MNWFYSLSAFEYTITALFVLAYLLFFWRIYRISKKLGTPRGHLWPKFLLRTGFLILAIIALLGPSFGSKTKEIKSVGKDIMMCVDLSQSMNAVDIPPTRLARVKNELNNIIDAFNSDRIGLIIFSSEAFVQCPLTYDQSVLRLYIETLHSGLVPKTGTDLGPPLRLALEKLETEESVVDPKAKVIILISDGEDFGEETPEMARKIKERGIKVYTLGVGTTRGGKIKTAAGFKRDQNGNEVISKLNKRSLLQLAKRTGGEYFEISDQKNDVERLINSIKALEGQLRDTRIIDVSANKYIYFLAAALLLLVLDMLTTFKTIKI